MIGQYWTETSSWSCVQGGLTWPTFSSLSIENPKERTVTSQSRVVDLPQAADSDTQMFEY